MNSSARPGLTGVVGALWVAAMCGAVARAQCTVVPVPGVGVPGVHGSVSGMTRWDPDGTGPAPARLVFGGRFTSAGDLFVENLAAFEPSSGGWSMLGGAPNGPVSSLAVLPDGRLVIGGSFTRIAGVPVGNLAAFDGLQWWPLGSPGTFSNVTAMAVLADGRLAVGGFAQGSHVKLWNGVQWFDLATILDITALAVTTGGELLAGGSAAGVFGRIAKWSGNQWINVGAGSGALVVGSVRAILPCPNGDLVIGGNFEALSTGVRRVARWDGATWVGYGAGLSADVCALAMTTEGLCAGHESGLSRWNGATWSPLDAAFDGRVAALLAPPEGGLYAGGDFTFAGGAAVRSLARWDGASWSRLAGGWNGFAYRLVASPNGDLFAAGPFTLAGGVAARYIARRHQGGWQALGSGSHMPTSVLTVLPNGNPVVSDGLGVKEWRDGSWVDLGYAQASTLMVLADGSLVGGIRGPGYGAPDYFVARWTGASWEPLGGPMNGRVSALLDTGTGTLVASGDFTSIGAVPVDHIARWNGSAWESMAGLSREPNALARLPDGSVVACIADQATGQGLVERWNGVTWTRLGTSSAPITAMATLPTGDLLVGGYATMDLAGAAGRGLARWDGQAWTPVGSALGVDGLITALAVLPSGEIVVSGTFDGIVGAAGQYALSAHTASIVPTCPAVAESFGVGCSGRAGPMVCTATAMPWLGGQFATRTTGISDPAIALAVFGFSIQVALLSDLHPLGGPGCLGLVALDLVKVSVPTGGVLEVARPVPSSSALVGMELFFQAAQIELDAVTGAAVAITSSNALQLRIGTM